MTDIPPTGPPRHGGGTSTGPPSGGPVPAGAPPTGPPPASPPAPPTGGAGDDGASGAGGEGGRWLQRPWVLAAAGAIVGAAVAAGVVMTLAGNDDSPQSSATATTSSTTTSVTPQTTVAPTVAPTVATTVATTTTLAPATTAAPTTAAPPPPATASCQNTSVNFQLEYPAGWYTIDNPEWVCALLDPAPITLIPDTEIFPVAISILNLGGTFDENVSIVADPVDATVLQSIESETAGRLTLCSSLQTGGEGYYPAGTQMVSCLVDWGPSSLLIDVVDWETVDYEASLDALDLIFATLAPLTPLPPAGG